VHLPSVWAVFGPLGSGVGYLVSDGLCRICAACRVASLCPPSQHAATIVRMVMQGHRCRDGSGREESHAHGRRGSSGDDQRV
jgi:hypothetical protein